MNQITLNSRWLKGAAICAATNDIRYYLNGVLVDILAREVRIVATDGHFLVCLREETPKDDPDNVPAQVIIPGDVLKAMKPGKRLPAVLTYATNSLECTLDTFTGTALTFKAVDAKFPDYMRVLPAGQPSGELGFFDHELIARMGKAARTALDSGKAFPELWPSGRTGTAAVVVPGYPEFFGAIMPRHASETYDRPEWIPAFEPAKPAKLKAVA